VATHFNVCETCQSKRQPCPLVPSLLGNIKRKARDVAYWTNPSRLATANEGAFPSSVRYCGINVRSRTVFVSPLTAVVAYAESCVSYYLRSIASKCFWKATKELSPVGINKFA
jgi:hypothetical protein